MSYTINRTNGTTLGTILDGTYDNTHTSLTLLGRNYSNYGQVMLDNLVKLVENFSYGIPPANPLSGQLWWDSTNNVLKVYTGTIFKAISSASTGISKPTTTVPGDFWWDTANSQLYIYDGRTPYADAGWVLVGPAYSKNNGKSGAVWEVFTANTSPVTTHQVVSLYLDDARIAVISKSAEFESNVVVNGTGFGNIKPGINLTESTTPNSFVFNGSASNATKLNNVQSTEFIRRYSTLLSGEFAPTSQTIATGINVNSDTGITVGQSSTASISSTNTNIDIIGKTSGSGMHIGITASTGQKNALTINGVSGLVEVIGNPTTALGIATKQYLDNTITGLDLPAQFAAINANLSVLDHTRIYSGSSYLQINATGAQLIIDGSTGPIIEASSNMIRLIDHATIADSGTFSQTIPYPTATAAVPVSIVGPSNSEIATKRFVQDAAKRWNGSAKFVSVDAPTVGSNDAGSEDGDIWFQYKA